MLNHILNAYTVYYFKNIYTKMKRSRYLYLITYQIIINIKLIIIVLPRIVIANN